MSKERSTLLGNSPQTTAAFISDLMVEGIVSPIANVAKSLHLISCINSYHNLI